ncbi:amidase [Pseudohoeflea coraliihabitans]|uniref:Indoleacetamide hydrolase n=1 Tax=Pseudohoeflea coraliihabitans TaxID=2860393 RepID=A0ABS6WPB5_9HYPH|nr:amidase [Pseudohoeflea sp. DP4N28-3]MBW3097807.1 amidase [Pseudohoeflea sp. DP4N28-3]
MPDLQAIASRSAAAIGRALQAGETTPVALVEHLLETISDQSSPVFLAVTAERARTEARAAEQRLADNRPLSPLDGVPVAWKDLIDVEGVPTTAGSAVYRDQAAATRDAPVVTHLAGAGMVTLGKLNLTEFAYSGLGLNPHFGTPVNPHGNGAPRVPGGSSSGCGVAVASGMVPCAIGTDTGGSIRIPAAFNGITGFKPSGGRIDDTRVFPLSRSLDTIGPLARSVEDCILLDAALRGATAPAMVRRPLHELSIFVAETVVLDAVDPAVMANFEASLRRLEQHGATIRSGPLPIFARTVELAARYGSIAAADAYAEHRELVDGPDVSRIDSRVVDRIMGGKKMTAHDLIMLQRARRDLVAELRSWLDGALVAMPTVAHIAPQIAPLEADKELFHRVNLKTLRNTMVGNFLDLPGLAMPNGVDENQMPTGFLLSAASGRDEDVLSFGPAVEAALAAGTSN